MSSFKRARADLAFYLRDKDPLLDSAKRFMNLFMQTGGPDIGLLKLFKNTKNVLAQQDVIAP